MRRAHPLAGKVSALNDLLRLRALTQPDTLAYKFLSDSTGEERALTYAQVDRQARAIAAWLQDAGATGARVMLLYPPGLEFISAFFGCLYAGAVAVPAYPPDAGRLNRSLPRLKALVADGQISLAATTADLMDTAGALFNQVAELSGINWLATDSLPESAAGDWREFQIDADLTAFLQYTSGSTGKPKGVMLTHDNLLYNAAMVYTAFEHNEEDKYVSWLPTFHDMGFMAGILQPLYAGIPAILMSPLSFLQNPARWLQAISEHRGTISGGPNFAYDLCLRKIGPEQRASLDLSSWKVAFNGAEPIRSETLERFASVFKPCGFSPEAFYPCYGLAEATLIVSGGLQSNPPTVKAFEAVALENRRLVMAQAGAKGAINFVGCGFTLLDQEIKIVDPESLVACPSGTVGEIWVSGPSVAKGYWNQADETERTFRARLADTGEGPFLRTGDLGFIQDDELFVTGRTKDLIIIRGLNHYPQDIELTAETAHEALRPGCGAAFSVELEGEERLVLVQEIDRRRAPDTDAVIKKIRQAIAEDHDLQLYAVVLIGPGAIAKTSSGKIRRQACRSMFLSNSFEPIAQNMLVAPSVEDASAAIDEKVFLDLNPQQRQAAIASFLRPVIARILKTDLTRVEDNEPLTRLGMDSLMAVELSNAITEGFGVEVKPLDLLSSPGIDSLATRISSSRGHKVGDEIDGLSGAAKGLTAITRQDQASAGKHLPLSFAQQRLWFLDQLAQGNPFYNLPLAIRLSGALKADSLQEALNEIIKRHETLRSSFPVKDAEPVQVIAPAMEMRLEKIDLSGLSESRRETETRSLAREAVTRPFDLSNGPLIWSRLIKLSPREHILIVAMHHIISDGWSLGLFTRELGELYKAISRGEPSTLENLPVQYSDYSIWEQQAVESEHIAGLLKHWMQRLEGAPPLLRLSSDKPRASFQLNRGAREEFVIGADAARALKRLSHQEGATLFITLAAAFNVLLYRYTGQQDLVIGTVTHGRNSAEIRNLIGFFANTVVLRTTINGGQRFSEFLETVRADIHDAYAHSDIPFEMLVRTMRPERDLSYTPLFQEMFVLQNDPFTPAADETFDGVSLSRVYHLEDTGTAKRDLTFYAIDAASCISGILEYDSDLFDAEMVRQMARHLTSILEAVAADPHRLICEIPVLSPNEREQLQNERNDTARDFRADLCIHELIEEQAARTPDAVAVECEGAQICYGELNGRANQLGHYLRGLGVGPEVLVGLCVERSIEMVVGVLAVIKAGGAYVPLDPGYPKERLAHIAENAQVRILLTSSRIEENLITGPELSILLDTDWAIIANESRENLPNLSCPANLAYVIYTSGSTGTPKGVMITHKSLSHYAQMLPLAISITQEDKYLHTASFSFSSSVRQLMVPLSLGCAVIIASLNELLDPIKLFTLIKETRVTVIDLVPSHWRNCNEALRYLENAERDRLLDNNLRLLLSASETLTSDLPNAWAAEFGQDTHLVNMFGQTETTGIVAIHSIPEGHDEQTEMVPIGDPTFNSQMYILDGDMRLTPVGVPGELHIGGVSLARGYFNNPALTAERMLPDPYGRDEGARLYKTGDKARYEFDGNTAFLGRFDNQVKVRGMMVEPSEIEKALLRHPSVREAVVAQNEGLSGNSLLAYIVPGHGQNLSLAELRSFLKEKLPEHMIPARYMLLDALPLLPNGKVNRRALPGVKVQELGRSPVSNQPGTPTERKVAEIWAELLDLDQIDLNDNFFELGGHSLLATRVVSRIRDHFGMEFPLRSLFEKPTIAGLAHEIDEAAAQAPSRNELTIKAASRGRRTVDSLFDELSRLSQSDVRALLDPEDRSE